nr:unnamed protein product [Spirometra erinaceieuropaei]
MALLHRSGRTESSVLQLATCTVKLLVLLLLLGLSLTVATARSSMGEKIDSAAEQMPQRTISLHSVAESSHRRPRNAFNSVQNTYPRTPYISFSDTNYVEIIKENIQPGMLRHFEKLMRAEVDSLGDEYDYSSIMHFRSDAFAKPGKNETIRPKQCCPRPVIGEATQPSAGDFRQVNKLYKCPSCGRTLLEYSGTFASPQYAGARQESKEAALTHAASNQDSFFCRWRIVAAIGERIHLNFRNIDMLPPANQSQNGKQESIMPADNSNPCVEDRSSRSYSPKFWARYVDDTFVVIKRNDVQNFKVLLNSIFPDIQFTTEGEDNNQLLFLDVNIHKPESTIRQQIMRPTDQLPATEQSAVVYSIPCQDCIARYVGETGKRLCTRLHEHQLAVNREDKLSLVYGHMQQEKHSFAFGEASVLSRAHDKMARLLLESWSSVGTINRAIDLHPAYQALRTRLQSVQTGPTVLASESRLLQQLSPSQQGEGASRRSHDERETSPHRRAQRAERDSHMQRQLIGSSDYEKPINNPNISIVYSSKSVCASGSANPYWTMIIVKSALTNYARLLQLRKIISREAVEAKVRVRVLFSLGLPANGQIPPDLLDEIAQFDDILLASYTDTYYNLTLKTISNLRFVHRRCLHASSTFVFLDDDHGISLKQLRRFFSNFPLSEIRRSIFGHINAGSPVMRTNESKWMTDRKAFPFPKYPQYAAGPCYIIGADLISKFSIAPAFTQLFPVEDVFVGIIAAKLGLRIRPLPKMHIHRSRIPRRAFPLVAELKFFARKPIT